MFSALQDFEPVVESITKVHKTEPKCAGVLAKSRALQAGLKEPYDWDEYASVRGDMSDNIRHR